MVFEVKIKKNCENQKNVSEKTVSRMFFSWVLGWFGEGFGRIFGEVWSLSGASWDTFGVIFGACILNAQKL